jgi:Ser/Thr protein kinase RdoA (MazF antagonist)
MTYKITDRDNGGTFLLRIHKPVTEGFIGIQHSLEGLKSETVLLQELIRNRVLGVQMPVANRFGEYLTVCRLEDMDATFYATLLEWIDGDIFTHEEENLEEIIYAIGVNLARFHHFTRASAVLKDLHRPVYGSEKIDSTLEKLKHGVEVDIYSMEHYRIMSEVLTQVKGLMRELDLQEGTWGLIHADIQRGNIVITESGEPCFIDFCLSGYGYYLFDIGSASTKFESKKRDIFLKGYTSKAPLSKDSLRFVEGMILMDIFLCYAFFIRDSDRNGWIKDHVVRKIELWIQWLSGKEIYYLL